MTTDHEPKSLHICRKSSPSTNVKNRLYNFNRGSRHPATLKRYRGYAVYTFEPKP